MSNETQWTPGPWHAIGERIAGPSNATVAMAHLGYGRAAANARLIAAAPEMAELLKEILIRCDAMQAGSPSDLLSWQDANRVSADQCRALLAKVNNT